MNRFWQQCFGTGLVKTAADFGSQGELPSHPAVASMCGELHSDDAWDVKKTMSAS